MIVEPCGLLIVPVVVVMSSYNVILKIVCSSANILPENALNSKKKSRFLMHHKDHLAKEVQ